MEYDVIVVGARCAGASTAMLLARSGKSVLMLDRDTFPSDMVNSTHFIWSSGAQRLAKWGLLDALEATNCPPQIALKLDLDAIELNGNAPTPEGMESCYAPRREILDNLLVSSAIDAGAQLEEKCSVEALLKTDDRVCGVQYRNRHGAIVDAKAALVIGADGINSTIAKLVNAREYNQHPKQAQAFYSYFDSVDLKSAEFFSRPGRMVFAWPTNDGLTLAGFQCPAADATTISNNEEGYMQEMQALAPGLAERLQSGTRVEPVRTAGTRNFMRQANGPGWALIGDAGITMDPITAAGISNAFWQADELALAIIDGMVDGPDSDKLDSCLHAYAEKRDSQLGAHYDFTVDFARLDPEPPEAIVQMLMALPGHQQDIDDYFGVFAMTVPIADYFSPENMQRIIDRGPAEVATAKSMAG